MDECAELLREIERSVMWATVEGPTGVLDRAVNPTVSPNRAPEAIRKIAAAMVKARTLRGVKW